jgi:CHAT domain-containing protein
VYAPERVGLDCPRCQQPMLVELSVIRNLAAEPHLVTEVRDGTIFGAEPLGLRELVERQLLAGVRLTFLSACQSGVTDVLTLRDEVIGFPSACLYSGAIGVVATLWPVDDAATFLFVRRFYVEYRFEEEYRDGAAARALTAARNWLRSATAAEITASLPELADHPAALTHLRLRDPDCRPYADPVFWAPFVYVGA